MSLSFSKQMQGQLCDRKHSLIKYVYNITQQYKMQFNMFFLPFASFFAKNGAKIRLLQLSIQKWQLGELYV